MSKKLAFIPSINSLPKYFCLLTIFISFQSIFCQNPSQSPPQATALKLNEKVENKIRSGETQNYQLRLNENQYAKIIIDQNETDVSAQIFAPDGTLITAFDNEPRTKATEIIEFVAPKTGDYQLGLKAKYQNSAGLYEIRLAELREAAARDQELFETTILSQKADEFDRTGKYSDALAFNARALEISEKHLPAGDARIGFLLGRLGFSQRRKGDYTTAEKTLQQAIAVSEKALGAEHPQTVDVIRYLALVYLATDDFAKADKLFRQVISTTEKTLGAEHPRIVTQLLGLQTLMFYLDDLDQAEKIGRQALAIAEKTLDPESTTMTFILNNLGTIYYSKGDTARAEPMLRRVLAIYEKTIGTENNDYALTLQNLGNIIRRQKDYPQALTTYKRALAIREKTLGAEHLNIAPLLINIATVYHAMGKYTEAVETHKRAYMVAEKSGGLYHEYTFTSLGSVANDYAALGDADNALTFSKLAEERTEAALALNLAIGSERQKLAQLGSIANKTSQVVSLNINLAPANQQASALAALLILQRKGRVLDAMSDAFAALRTRANAEDKKLLEDLDTVTKELAKAALSKPSKVSLDEQRKQIADLTEKKENIEAEISRRSAEFQAASQTVTLEAVKAEIPLNAALIEFAVYSPYNPKPQDFDKAYGEPRYIAYVLQRTGDVKYAELGDAKAINQAIKEWRDALRDPKRKDAATLARAVDAKVMQPIRQILGGAKQLLISPDDGLNLIPFEALVDENGKYLIENLSFNYLSSGRDLLRMKTKRASKSESLLIANPQFGASGSGSEKDSADDKTEKDNTRRASVTVTRDLSETYFAPISGTVQEVRIIQTLFPKAVFLTGAEASETALKKTTAPQILHVATHGFFLTNESDASKDNGTRGAEETTGPENPLLRSGLAMAGANHRDTKNTDDGILTALEASGLNLWGTKLVVLSACDTGLGDVKTGEGVYGLRRAFVLAGTESLVMSLWSVSDYATRELMTEYYKNLKNGMGRAAALQKVKLGMLKKKGREHPFYWASFIESGEWATLDGKR